MSQLSSCSDVQIRWVHKYLHLIKEINSEKCLTSLEDINIEDLIHASNDLSTRKAALGLFEDLRGGRIKTSICDFLSLLKNGNGKLNDNFEVISTSDNFETVIDDEFLSPLCGDENIVKGRVNSALLIINNVSSDWKSKIAGTIQTVSGIDDIYNVINSGFTKDFPGFISLNINADLPILAEEIVHESTHLLFDNLIYFDPDFKDKLKKIPPVYSIFAKKPRTIELVLHGLFSYTSVYIFWEKLAKINPAERIRSKNRIIQVSRYINEAILNLNNVLDRDQWKLIKEIYKSICPIFKEDLWNNYPKKQQLFDYKILHSLSDSLNYIESAELLLAIEGNKVSRISKPISQITNIIQRINSLPVFYCFSNYIFSSNVDNSINGFHNVISDTYSLTNLDSYISNDLSIHIYFSSNQQDLFDAFYLDQEDNCAELFKTPKCCESFFKNKWDYALQYHNGDLTKLYFENIDVTHLIRELKYNPIPMYFGKGLCWHFPCSLECDATKDVVNERVEILNRYPEIFDKINVENRYYILVDNKLEYRLVEF